MHLPQLSSFTREANVLKFQRASYYIQLKIYMRSNYFLSPCWSISVPTYYNLLNTICKISVTITSATIYSGMPKSYDPAHLHRDKIMLSLVEIESFSETKHHTFICLDHTVPSVCFLNCLSSPLSFRVSVKTFPTWLTPSIRYTVFMDVWLICQFCYFSVTCHRGSAPISLEFWSFCICLFWVYAILIHQYCV